jgi:hypothetical protein
MSNLFWTKSNFLDFSWYIYRFYLYVSILKILVFLDVQL